MNYFRIVSHLLPHISPHQMRLYQSDPLFLQLTLKEREKHTQTDKDGGAYAIMKSGKG
jgi:hypothetical protein